MDICAFHEELISEYARFSRSFTESTRQGLVKLTHHKLRHPQDIVSEATSAYSMGWLGPSVTS